MRSKLFFALLVVALSGCDGVGPVVPGEDGEDETALPDTASIPTFPALEHHLSVLAHDSMRGRDSRDGIGRTEEYVWRMFTASGLSSFPGLVRNRHEFTIRSGSIEAANVVAYLEGTDPVFRDEVIVFSAHHDHLGVRTPVDGDSIYNGADDNASGVAAVLALAQRYAQAGGNARSLLFVTFSAEEMGLLGSRALSRDMETGAFPITLDRIVTVVNIDMIGGASLWGEGQALLTGDDRSDLFEIAREALEEADGPESTLVLNRDPIPALNLFFRSDNWPFAERGVVAHTVTTYRPGNPHYHAPSDEVEHVSVQNLHDITLGIWDFTRPLVAGERTPVLLPEDGG